MASDPTDHQLVEIGVPDPATPSPAKKQATLVSAFMKAFEITSYEPPRREGEGSGAGGGA